MIELGKEIETPIPSSVETSSRRLKCELEEGAPDWQISYRSSSRLKRPNKMYPEQLYVLK